MEIFSFHGNNLDHQTFLQWRSNSMEKKAKILRNSRTFDALYEIDEELPEKILMKTAFSA